MTNFHLPESTLLMLVSAFTDKEILLGAYYEAINNNYRFLVMAILCLFTKAKRADSRLSIKFSL